MVGREEKETIDGWVLDDIIGPKVTFNQGDLIKFENENDPLKKVGIIVTADCDLENKKHAKTLTLVPVIEPKVIFEYYLIPEDCENKKDIIESYIFKKFSINTKQEPVIKLAILREFIHSSNVDKNSLEYLAANLLLGQLSFVTINAYKALMKEINVSAKKLESFQEQIRKRGDLLILPAAQKLGISGCVAWVRHIWQVPISSVAIKTSEIQNCPGERVARLDSPYRYRLTQLMAQVFSDIGLPGTPGFIDKLIEDTYNNG